MNQDLYSRPDIYDIVYQKETSKSLEEHYMRVLNGKDIKTIHDCSIGTGQLTFALADMGYEVSGSDLSVEMLDNASTNAKERGLAINLFQSDFRVVSEKTDKIFDCVMSTGNSLAHVDKFDVKKTLESMSKMIKPGGYLYLDTRNWDKILDRRQRFYCYNPFIRENERINLVQVWDYVSDDEIVFNLLYTFEKDNKIFRQEEVQTKYHPLRKVVILDSLQALGFENVEVQAFMRPDITEFDQMDWYCVCARKSDQTT